MFLKLIQFILIISIISTQGCKKKTTKTETYNSKNDFILGYSTGEYINEPYFTQQWHIEKNDIFYDLYDIDNEASIHANGMLSKYSGRNIAIAIIDNGADINHPDLKNAIFRTYNPEDQSTNVAHSENDEHHGTSVAGIIGARVNRHGICGIAYNSKLIIIKLNLNGMVSNLDIIDAFDYANQNGASVINNSWGTDDVDDAVADKIDDLALNGRNGKGMIIIFASGNDDKSLDDAGVNDESELPNVLGVGASQKDNLRAYYSNYGSKLDIVAPGGDNNLGIMTIDPINNKGLNSGNDDPYLYANSGNIFIGTSASAPVLSGAIAVILEVNPNLTREQLFDILKRTSDKIGDEGYQALGDGTSRNDYYGYGKINLKDAIDLAKTY
jgi:subtilisin family serine protease